jgi:hypothetical protein
MQKEKSIDHALRATWQAVAKSYNEQAAKHQSTMAMAMALLYIDPGYRLQRSGLLWEWRPPVFHER